uniref:Uncharacterized protein n=1 Tax=Arundo donax TaxID=35708 RepID=A0A0A9BTZ3_ARUDO
MKQLIRSIFLGAITEIFTNSSKESRNRLDLTAHQPQN